MINVFFIALTAVIFFSGCGKKATPPNSLMEHNSFFSNSPTPENAIRLEKMFARPARQKVSDSAAHILQLVMGLRDAAREQIHAITPCANGKIFYLDNQLTTCDIAGVYSSDSQNITSSHWIGVSTEKTINFHCAESKNSNEPLSISFTIKPTNNKKTFSTEFLDATYDSLENGYASNEINLKIFFGEQTVSLCRKANPKSLSVALAPELITITIHNIDLNPCDAITTFFNILQTSPRSTKEKEIVMEKKVLFILMPQGFQDLEFTYPYNTLVKEKFIVDVASTGSGNCVGTAGLTVTPSKILSAMSVDDFDSYDALVIPGGNASPQFLWGNEEVLSIVRYFHEKKKLVATICWASVVPAQAGILKNRKATVYPTDDAKKILADNGAIFTDVLCQSLEQEKIITAQSPKAVIPFVDHILRQLKANQSEREMYG